ncbi:hypothetical protein Btru_050591 [Bulinus truncatus]|nr:hypothetical protein Btru_050591 [Bulinus truncatus]
MIYHNRTNLTDEEKLAILEDINHQECVRLIPSIVILALFSCSGTIGNFLSVFIFASRMKRNFQNNMFIYLCVTNIVACAVCIPGDMVDLVFAYSYPSSAWCKVTRFFNLFTISSYVLTLGSLSVYRLRAARTARLTADTKKTSVRGILALIFGSLAIAWLGVIVYGLRATPTRVKDVFGRDCSIDDGVTHTGWLVAYYSFLALGFATLVLTVGISYYKIWRIVRHSKMTVAAHTTINVASPAAATGLAVVTSPQDMIKREPPPAPNDTEATTTPRHFEEGAASRMLDLLPSIFVVYQTWSPGAESPDSLTASFAPLVSGVERPPIIAATASSLESGGTHLTQADDYGAAASCDSDIPVRTSTKESIYERFINNSFKSKSSTVKCRSQIIRRNRITDLRAHSRSNPDLATIGADDDKTHCALIRTLSVSELGYLDQSLATRPKLWSWRNINKDLINWSSTGDNSLSKCDISEADSKSLIERDRSVKNSHRHSSRDSLTVDGGVDNIASSKSRPMRSNYETRAENPRSRVESHFSNALTENVTISKGENCEKEVEISEKEQNATTTEQPFSSTAAPRNGPMLSPIKTTARTRNTKTALENAITRTAFLLTFIFIVTFLPFFAASIPHFMIQDFDYNQGTVTLNIINMAYRLYFVNPTISPFIFWASNLDFRRNFKALCSRD